MHLSQLSVGESSISCGILEVYDFDSGYISQIEQDLKKLRTFRVDQGGYINDHDEEPNCTMYICSLAEYQFDIFETILRKHGWTRSTRAKMVNPNTGNEIRLYALVKRVRKPKKKKETLQLVTTL